MVYVATNSINGKRYIGQTSKTLEQRRRTHERNARSGRLSRFYSALRKYGPVVFNWCVLSIAMKPETDALEKAYIQFYGTRNPLFGYNLSAGGEGMSNPSAETLRRMSESHKGQSHNRGLKRSAAVCQAMRERMLGTAYHLGHTHSPETKEKMRLAKLGKKRGPVSDATRAKMSAAQRGRRHTPEAKAKMAISQKARFASNRSPNC